MVTDSLSDLIIQLKNASIARKESILFPYSKLSNAVAEALKHAGYIEGIAKKGKKVSKFLEITLLYKEGASVIKDVKRISKPSKRMYMGASEIRSVRNGYGRLFLSTPKGILTDKEARKEKVGGEALFEMW
jgi:small subunit ribosomal protein S8